MKRKYAKPVKTLSAEVSDTLLAWAKSQLIIMAVVAFASWLLLYLLRVKYDLLLAVMTGALSVIPFAGLAISGLIAAMVAIVDGSRFLPGLHQIFEGLAVLVAYFILNQLVDILLAPYLIGKISRIHPVLVFAAVIVGTMSMGIFGTLLAVPVLLVTRTVLEYYRK